MYSISYLFTQMTSICQRCRQYMIIAPMPEQPIDKGLVGAALLAEIIINKIEKYLNEIYNVQLASPFH